MRKTKGFTLIELAIVIALVGIMTAVAVPKFMDMSRDAEIAGCEEFFKGLQTSTAIYLMKEKVPPTKFSDFLTSGDVVGSYVLSTRPMLNSGHISSFAPADYSSTNMTVTTKSGAVINYYISGTSVTATFP